MSKRPGGDSVARRVLLIGMLLAAILVGLELSHRDDLPPMTAEGDIDAAVGRVRVLLARAGKGPWLLELAAGDRLRGRELGLGGRMTIGFDEAGLLVGDRPVAERLETGPAAEFSLDGRSYRGRLVLEPGLHARRPIIELPLEDYLAQVLPGEMPMSYPVEALAAQVIAARSYVVVRMIQRRGRPYDVSDSESSQMFQALGGQTERARSIVALSSGLVLSHEGRVLPAYYSANCGGHGRSNAEAFGEAPLSPLAGVECHHCSWSRHHTWSTNLSAAEVGAWFGLGGPVVRAHVRRGEGSGYDNRLDLRGPSASRLVSAAQLRRRSSGRLKSSFIVGADVRGDRLLLSGHGFGHGVGLCQNGARGMALADRDTRAILEHYYPGAELRRLKPTESP